MPPRGRGLPVPITFDYRETNLTGGGEQAPLELITALKEQRPSRILLIANDATTCAAPPKFSSTYEIVA